MAEAFGFSGAPRLGPAEGIRPMEREFSRPPVYRGLKSSDELVEILCGAMRQALECYNDQIDDYLRGKLDDDEFESFEEIDGYTWYEVADVRTDFGRAEHHLPPGFTGLVVCYCYVAIAEVLTVDDGAELIGLANGHPVTLVEEIDQAERCWSPRRLGRGPSDPPVEPSPDLPTRRRPTRV